MHYCGGMGRRAAKYRRISQDREGLELGVQRQDEDLDALAARRGLVIVAEYTDNDISASTRSRKRRPDYEQMLADARAGNFDVIIAATSGRLTRRPREFEDLIDLAERHGIEIEYVKSPSFDLRTAAGRRIARTLAAQDAAEAEEIGERVTRAARQRAEMGGNNGGRRAYGFGPVIGADPLTGKPIIDPYKVVPAEAKEIKRAARQVLAGVPLAQVVRDMNARGVTTVGGRAWASGTLRDMLLSPRLAGLSQYKGVVVAKAKWPKIISEAQHHALVALIRDPSRRTSTGNRASYLCSGIAECPICGGTVNAAGKKRSTPGGAARAIYRCGTNFCVGRRRDWVDNYVEFRILERLAQPDAEELLVDREQPDHEALREEANAIRVRKDGAAAAYARGRIDDRQLEIITAECDEQLADIERQQVHTSRGPILRPLIEAAAAAGDDLRARMEAVEKVWNGFDLDRHRAVLQVLYTVRIHPAGGGRRAFDPTKIELIEKG